MRKDTSNLFVCVLENFEKSGFLQVAFSKNGFMKTHFQRFFKMLCKLMKVFGFPKISKTDLKGTLFSNETISSCFPILQKENILFWDENYFQNCFCSKNHCLKKSNYS